MHKKNIIFFTFYIFVAVQPNIFFGTELTQQAIKQSKNTTSKAFFKVGTMHEVESVIKKSLEDINTNEVLLAFDVDMTLIHPAHPATHPLSVIKYRNEHTAILEKYSKDQQKMAFMLMSSLPQELVEIEALKTVEACQLKGIKTIAFTATFTGKLGEIQSVEESRYQQLKSFGFDFSQSFKDYPNVTLTECKPCRGNFPVFHKGILLSNGSSKGDALITFFKKTNFMPKVFIMVDDRQKNLEEVEITLKGFQRPIKFIEIEYEAIMHQTPKEIELKEFKKFWEDLLQQAVTI